MLRRKLLFWAVWLLAGPLVFIRYLFSNPRTALVETGLVRLSVYQDLVELKPEKTRRFLAKKEVENYLRENPYLTRKKYD